MVEQGTHNPLVAGSSPAGPTTKRQAGPTPAFSRMPSASSCALPAFLRTAGSAARERGADAGATAGDKLNHKSAARKAARAESPQEQRGCRAAEPRSRTRESPQELESRRPAGARKPAGARGPKARRSAQARRSSRVLKPTVTFLPPARSTRSQPHAVELRFPR